MLVQILLVNGMVPLSHGIAHWILLEGEVKVQY